MNALGKCPHCGERISPWRLLRVSRATPYACDKCGGQATVAAPSGRRAVLVYVAAMALPPLLLFGLGASDLVLYVAATAAALLIPVFLARFCRFEPVGQPATTGRPARKTDG